MRSLTNIVGILLIILGLVSLAYQGFSYTTEKKVAELGNLQLTQKTNETIVFPPLLGGLSLGAGVILLIVARYRK